MCGRGVSVWLEWRSEIKKVEDWRRWYLQDPIVKNGLNNCLEAIGKQSIEKKS
jgi:hypothetical protein